MIRWWCYECSTPMESPDSLSGRQIRCPACQANNRVPFWSRFEDDPGGEVIGATLRDPDFHRLEKILRRRVFWGVFWAMLWAGIISGIVSGVVAGLMIDDSPPLRRSYYGY